MIDFNLGDYTDLINLIFKRSNVESDNIQQFNTIQELWTKKLKFNLGKNFPIQLYKTGIKQLKQDLPTLNYLLV